MAEQTLDQMIDTAFAPISQTLYEYIFFPIIHIAGQDVPFILFWLVSAALFFTFYLGFVNIRYFRHAIRVVRGKYDTDDMDGQINRFQALTTTLSATVGLGNIAGVAVAVSVGGPGATFWMVLMGLFGMSTKFVEAALGVKYRRHGSVKHPDRVSGGPMYYLRAAFQGTRFTVVGRILAVIFAIFCIGGAFGGGNMFQANQAYQQVLAVTGGTESVLFNRGWLFGLGLAMLVGVVIIGGIKSIAAVAERVVPIMGGIYMAAGLVIIGYYYENIPSAIVTIFHDALSIKAGIGALLGGLLVGVQRAAFSNEAGIGTAAIGHSSVKTNDHISQGFVGMLGPFIDTVVICMVTALVIVISGTYTQYNEEMAGVELTSAAFTSVLPWFDKVLALTVFLFAYSTLIGWSYYGLKASTYIFGESDYVELGYKLLFCVFVIIGSSIDLVNVIAFTDAMVLAMAFPNILGLYLLSREIKRDFNAYRDKLGLGRTVS